MSIIPTSSVQVQFYLSAPAPCPYLADHTEQKLFTKLPHDETLDAPINSALTHSGFRRSHDIVYRPACPQCDACTPVRIPVNLFVPSRSQRKTINRNKALRWTQTKNSVTQEDFDLFQIYQKSRHAEGEMALMTWNDFREMIEVIDVDSHLFRLHSPSGELVGVMFCDRVADGLSAIYSYFHPNHQGKSLGTYLILSLITEARRQNLPYIYLGYWIAKSNKMSYKSRFTPLEELGAHGWVPFNYTKACQTDDKIRDTLLHAPDTTEL